MPRSDNLYSAEDNSDGESFSHELSPSDGYFNRTDMPPNAMVQDPSLDSKEEPKTLIAGRNVQAIIEMNSRSNSGATNSPVIPHSTASHNYASSFSSQNAASSSNIYTPSSPPSSRRTDNLFSHTHLIHGPPPAYSATVTPTTNPSQGLPPNRSFSTVSQTLLEQGLPTHHEPESMGVPVDEPNERTPLSSNSIRSSSNRRRIIGKILFVALVFSIIIAILTSAFKLISKSEESPKIPPKDPGTDMPPSDDRPVDSNGPYCPSATIRSDEVTYELPVDKNLYVLQTTHGNQGSHDRLSHVTTAGEVRLRRLPKDSENQDRAFFTLNIHVSDPNLEVIRSWDEEHRTLEVSTPRYARLDTPGPHCVSLEITAWLPEGAELTSVLVEAISLTLRVLDDIKLNVTGTSKFVTLSGDVYFPTVQESTSTWFNIPSTEIPQLLESQDRTPPSSATAVPPCPFSSRRTLVETVSGSIKGVYPLYDYLGLCSQSGSVGVGVYPQAALPSAPSPAELEVQTISGSIHVNLPVTNHYNPNLKIHARDYITRVHSSSGSIKGTYYLGSVGSFKSTSGSIELKVLPVIQTSKSKNAGDDPESDFETHTVSGTTQIALLDPIFISLLKSSPEQPVEQPRPNPYEPIGDEDPFQFIPPRIDDSSLEVVTPQASVHTWRTLRSTHTSNSAAIMLKYPDAWEGTIFAKTVSGGIAVVGKGVRTIREKKGWTFKEVVAVKGVNDEGEGSTVNISGIAGSVHFTVGF